MKKRSFLNTLLILTVLFMSTMNVLADTEIGMDKSVQEKKAILLCEYKDNENNVQNRIYYIFDTINYTNQSGPWVYFYRLNGSLRYLMNPVTNANFSLGKFDQVFQNARTSYQQDGKRMESSFENTFKCPKNAFADLDFFDEVCYGDFDTCGTNFEYGPFKLNEEANTIYKIIDDYAASLIADKSNIDLLIKGSDLTNSIRQKLKSYIISNYQFGTSYAMPGFVEYYIDNLKIDSSNVKVTQAISDLKNHAKQEIQKQVDEGKITQEVADKKIEEIEDKKTEDIVASVNKVSTNINMRDDPNCNGLLGTDMSIIINNIFKFVQYLGPVLIAAFSTVDFLKAATQGDDGQMKKAAERLMKRIICGILLFFVPLICSIILDIGGITLTETCIERYGTQESQ